MDRGELVKAEKISKREHPSESELPETIKILRDPFTNGTIYLVGTAHFSEKSQREVTQVRKGWRERERCFLFFEDHRTNSTGFGDGGIVSKPSKDLLSFRLSEEKRIAR